LKTVAIVFDQNVLPAIRCLENGDAAGQRINGKCFRAGDLERRFRDKLENMRALIGAPEDESVTGTGGCKKSDTMKRDRLQALPGE
jgi:hypothetical protein